MSRPAPPERVLERIREGLFIVAHPLALTRDLKIDFWRQRALTRYYIASGADGIAIGVHTTQFAVHRDFERMLKPLLEDTLNTIRECEKSIGSEIVRIAGVVGTTEQAVREAKLAWDLGYHAGLLSLHMLKGFSEERILEHIRQVSREIPIFGFYLQPAVGGLQLGYKFWRRFAEEIENLVAIKIAPFNRYYTIEVVRAVIDAGREDVALYTGNDDNIINDLLTSFRFKRRDRETVETEIVGGLLGQWAVWTRRFVEIYRFIKRIKREKRDIPRELLILNTHVTDANKAIFDVDHGFRGSIAGVLEVLRRSGFLEEVRILDPEESLSPGQIEEIDRVYQAYPHLRDDEFVSKYINSWFNEKCVGLDTLREISIEDIRRMISFETSHQ
ncbi:MAG: dihydrodipicolinate synthase family protein [Sulfolobales archaeon]